MIDPEHPQLSIVRQCELVSISRSGFYYQPAGETPLSLELMRLIDRQFLDSPRFTAVLQQAVVRVSMDGRGRWIDNVFIERLWRSLKYECIYLHAFETGSELRAGVAKRVGYYNNRRPHSTLAGRTPDEVYGITGTETLAA